MNYEKRLFIKQKIIIHKLKTYLNNLERSSINTSLSSLTYFFPGGRTPGFLIIKTFESFKKFFFNINHYLLSCLSHTIKSPELIVTQNLSNKKFKEIILTWGNKEQFKSDGSFHDKYFNINSKKNLQTLWIILVDKTFPHSNNNIIQIEENYFKKFSVKNFILQFIKTLYDNKFSLSKFLHYFPYPSLFAKNTSDILIDIIKENKIKKLMMPYEPQPFQQYLIGNTKKIKKNIKVVGYLHSAISSFPTEYIFRENSPDKLLVHGEGLAEILTKNLYWPKKRIKLISSMRYQNNKRKKFENNYIYLPYELNKAKDLINNFDKFLSNKKNNSLNMVKIKGHPETLNYRKNKIFIEKLSQILEKNKKKFSSKKNKMNINFCFGSSSVILELLESKKKVIQITSNPLFEIFNSYMWKYISIDKIGDNIFLYKLKKYKKYIKN